jgi:hypothetical protein
MSTTYNGYTLCWTIHQGFYAVADLKKYATDCAIPALIADEIRGLDINVAYRSVCAFGTKGKASVNPNKGQKSWYTTHSVGEYYVLSRLTTDSENVDVTGAKKPKPTLEHIGNLHLSGYSIALDPEAAYQVHKVEVNPMLVDLQNDLDNRYGKMSDVLIRVAMLNWCKSRFSIPLRTTGGIYYLPDTAGLDSDILALQTFFERSGIGSVFALPVQKSLVNLDTMKILREVASKVSLAPDVLQALRQSLMDAVPQQTRTEIVERIVEKTISIDITQAAIDALDSEILEINCAINDREKTRQNGDSAQIAGSREYSAKSYIDAGKKLEEKIGILQDNLGDKIGLVRSKLEIVMRRADTMAKEARQVVNLEASVREALAERPTYTNGNGSGKKSGTVKSRKDKSV